MRTNSELSDWGQDGGTPHHTDLDDVKEQLAEIRGHRVQVALQGVVHDSIAHPHPLAGYARELVTYDISAPLELDHFECGRLKVIDASIRC